MSMNALMASKSKFFVDSPFRLIHGYSRNAGVSSPSQSQETGYLAECLLGDWIVSWSVATLPFQGRDQFRLAPHEILAHLGSHRARWRFNDQSPLIGTDRDGGRTKILKQGGYAAHISNRSMSGLRLAVRCPRAGSPQRGQTHAPPIHSQSTRPHLPQRSIRSDVADRST